MSENYPRRGQDYTLQEIEKALYLRDSACLLFKHNGRECVIQNAHLTEDDLLSVPGLAATQWKYERETHEWIPIFHYAGDSAVLLACLDIEADKNDEGAWWVTPKGFPREQYVSEF